MRLVTVEEFLFFIDEALDGMVRVVVELGDERVNRRPDVEPINSPYVTLTHCLGVMEYWGGQVIAGRPTERDRAAEFRATGSVSDLVSHVQRARRQLEVDLAVIEPDAAPRGALLDENDASLPIGSSQGGALVHLYSELAIHRGHIEVCRDVLMCPTIPSVTGAAQPRPDSRYVDQTTA